MFICSHFFLFNLKLYFMRVLIMMLFNAKEQTFHPIMYFEHPFFGESNIIRFKSKGHRTIGLKDRSEALKTLQTEVIDRLKGNTIYKDLDVDLPWDGEGIPADNQLRDNNWIVNHKDVVNA